MTVFASSMTNDFFSPDIRLEELQIDDQITLNDHLEHEIVDLIEHWTVEHPSGRTLLIHFAPASDTSKGQFPIVAKTALALKKANTLKHCIPLLQHFSFYIVKA
jgi:hypothetical protein